MASVGKFLLIGATTAVVLLSSACKFNNQSKAKESDADIAFKAANMIPVTPGRDQGAIGFCWSYSTMAYLESLHKLRTKSDIKLSPLAFGFYHYVDLLKGVIANTASNEGVVALAKSIDSGDIDGSVYYDDAEIRGVLSLLNLYGVVPEEVYQASFVNVGSAISFKARSSVYKDATAAEYQPADLFHRELADNLIYLLETKGLAYLKSLSEPMIMQQLMYSRYTTNFTAEPPKSFTYQGKSYTPQTFLKDYLQIDVSQLMVKASSGAIANGNNVQTVDLNTVINDLNANFKAGIGVPIAFGIDLHRTSRGRFSTVAGTDQERAQRVQQQQMVDDFERAFPQAPRAFQEDSAVEPESASSGPAPTPPANPIDSSAAPVVDLTGRLDPRYATYVTNKTALAVDLQAWQPGGGHAMFAVGPTKAPLVLGKDSEQVILKNSWAISAVGKNDPLLTSDGFFIVEEGYLKLAQANAMIQYVVPKVAGQAPFFKK